MGDTLFTNGNVGLQWFLNGAQVEGATGSRLTGNESGVYEVSVSLGSCSVRSSPLTFTTIDELITALDHNALKLYPNPTPASGITKLTIEFFARTNKTATIPNYKIP